MRGRRILSLFLLVGTQPVLWIFATTAHSRRLRVVADLIAGASANAGESAPASPDPGDPEDSIARIFGVTLRFIGDIARSLERDDPTGALIRLLIIVEVLIGAVGIVSCITVWGQGKIQLVYRIIDVMGALFLVITLMLLATLIA
jgi:hypothetical protein